MQVKGNPIIFQFQVGVGFMCLWCNEKSKCFTSLSSVQKHMVDKGHCKAKHEGNAIAEYAPFYDYTASYPEGQRRPEGSTVGENGELVDEEVELEGLDDSGYEMTLPSGAKVGHRDLMRYYK